eukprot:tig00020552_g10478.t1
MIADLASLAGAAVGVGGQLVVAYFAATTFSDVRPPRSPGARLKAKPARLASPRLAPHATRRRCVDLGSALPAAQRVKGRLGKAREAEAEPEESIGPERNEREGPGAGTGAPGAGAGAEGGAGAAPVVFKPAQPGQPPPFLLASNLPQSLLLPPPAR